MEHKTVGISADLPYSTSTYEYYTKLSFNSIFLKRNISWIYNNIYVFPLESQQFCVCAAAGVIKNMNSIMLHVP